MPKPRTPTSILEARGSFAHDPARARKDFDSGAFNPAPPAYFKPAQVEAWDEIVQLLPPGVLQATDRIAVELAARQIARFRSLDDLDVTMAQVAQVRAILATLGMTPADRSRVTAAKPLLVNPFLALVAKHPTDRRQ